MRTVAIVNQKGGCGKTTTAINLAGVLASLGHRTLLVDLDPQAHCAVGLGVPDENIDQHIGDWMLASPERKLDPTRLLWRAGRNLELAPSSMKLAGLEAARGGIADSEDRDLRLAGALERLGDRFDWRLIDCPPSVGLLTFNALRAATEVLIPVETSFFAMRGADRQVRTIRSLARRLGGQTPFRILATMHDPENELAARLLDELSEQFGDRLVPHVIRLDPKLKEATMFGQPLIEYEESAPGARDYTALAKHLIENLPPRGTIKPAAVKPSVPRTRTGRAASSIAEGKPIQPNAVPETKTVESVTPTRAADLARRARELMTRSATYQAKLETDPDLALGEQRREQEARAHTAELEARLARMNGPVETSQGVLFVHPGPEGLDVRIAGDFNGWSHTATRMNYRAQFGHYEVCVPIPVGRCEYRLLVNGRWVSDPFNENKTHNPFGETNNIVVVTRARMSAGAGAFGEGAD